MGRKIYREIFEGLPTIDDRMGDWKQDERDKYTKELYQNTLKILNYGIPIPVKESHEHTDEKMKGHITGLKLKRKHIPTPHYAIEAEINMDEDLYRLYQENKLPQTSVEIAENANLTAVTGKETKIGEYISALAMLGNSPPAMPNLKETTAFDGQQIAMFARFVEPKNYNLEKEEKPMSILEKLKSAIMNAFKDAEEGDDEDVEIIVEKGDEEEDDMGCKEKEKAAQDMDSSIEKAPADAVEEEIGKEDLQSDKEQEIEELKAQLADTNKRLEALQGKSDESEFQELVRDGKAAPEDNEKFMRIVRTKGQGMKFAREVFSKKVYNVESGKSLIPSGDAVQKMKNDELTATLKQDWGWNDEQCKDFFKQKSGKGV